MTDSALAPPPASFTTSKTKPSPRRSLQSHPHRLLRNHFRPCHCLPLPSALLSDRESHTLLRSTLKTDCATLVFCHLFSTELLSKERRSPGAETGIIWEGPNISRSSELLRGPQQSQLVLGNLVLVPQPKPTSGWVALDKLCSFSNRVFSLIYQLGVTVPISEVCCGDN